MAEDDTKGRATRKPRTAKKPLTKAKAAPARTAKTRAKAPTEHDTKSEAETAGAPAPEDAKGSSSDPGPRRPLGLLGALAAVAVVAAAVLAWPGAWDRLAGMFSGPPPVAPVSAPSPAPWAELGDRLGALEKTVAQIGADIAALKSAPPPAKADDGAALKAVEDRLAALASSVKAMEGQLAKPAAPSEESGTLALMALAGNLRRGAPFAPLAARVRGSLAASGDGAGVAGALEGLAGYAVTGVPTRSALAARLEAIKPPSPKTDAPPAKAESKPQQPVGLWDRVKSNLSNLVKIRRKAGEKPPASDPVALSRAAANTALAKGDLAAALKASAGLTGPQAEAWRKDLRARISADALALALDGAIAKRLGPRADNP